MFEYLKKGRCHGPITSEELLELVESGVLGPDDLVRRTKELGFRSVRETLAIMQTTRQLAGSRPPPRLSASGRPSTAGGYTVFTSAPPIPANPVPQLEGLHCPRCGVAVSTPGVTCASCSEAPAPVRCARCGHEYPGDARFCGGCGGALSQPP